MRCLDEDFKPLKAHDVEADTMILVHEDGDTHSYRCLLCGQPETIVLLTRTSNACPTCGAGPLDLHRSAGCSEPETTGRSNRLSHSMGRP